MKNEKGQLKTDNHRLNLVERKKSVRNGALFYGKKSQRKDNKMTAKIEGSQMFIFDKKEMKKDDVFYNHTKEQLEKKEEFIRDKIAANSRFRTTVKLKMGAFREEFKEGLKFFFDRLDKNHPTFDCLIKGTIPEYMMFLVNDYIEWIKETNLENPLFKYVDERMKKEVFDQIRFFLYSGIVDMFLEIYGVEEE